MSNYKTIFFNISILALIALGLLLLGFVIGINLPKADAEIGATCPTTVQGIEGICKCPDPVYNYVGCADAISGSTQVKITGATKIILDDKIYNVSDITNSSVKSTPALTK